MAIRVICSGCMTSFEVDDRFAGKKGPCPKCGHIIEIPKEQVIIHAPDTIVDSSQKTARPLGHDARPILQRRFVYTGKQVFWGVLGSLGAVALAYLVGALCSATVSAVFGAIAVFLIAFPIAEFGYMLIRDDNDLEMFLGNERHMRSLKVAIVFGVSWLAFEILARFVGTGPIACVYLLLFCALGAIGALIFFDCNYGKALLVYFMFAFAAILCRGLLFQWDGWVWVANNRNVVAAPKVDVERARLNGTTAEADAEEIVANRTAIQNASKERSAKAANKNSNPDESGEQDNRVNRRRMKRR